MSIAVVIPCFRVRDKAAGVIAGAALRADAVYVVDDACPEGTATHLAGIGLPAHVRLIANPRNLGVGGAVLAGYRAALADGHDVIVKVDGDGQMDPALIPLVAEPVLRGEADYAKGNRFFDPRGLAPMPWTRLLGNAGLSFLTKLASGYWDVFDPANGFTAIHARIVERLPLDAIERRWAFESDMLYRLGTLRARVIDVPMPAHYGDEKSNLSPSRVALPLLWRSLKNAAKRIGYNYFLRDFPVGSLYLILAALLLPTGLALGVHYWLKSMATGIPATSGQVMLAALPLIAAGQLLLAFLAADIAATPRRALHPHLPVLPR